MKTKLLFHLLIILLVTMCVNASAKTPAELSAESEKYCASTSSDKVSPELIIQKIEKASELIKKEGKAAFDKFMGNGSEFLFAGTYIWIHDKDGVILMHPIKHKLVGKSLIGIKDKTGKRFIAMMNQVTEENGAGWVNYYWPKPGEKTVSLKTSYAKRVKSADGIDMILGCGVYDMNDELQRKGYQSK